MSLLKPTGPPPPPTLPAYARLPINRCNQPAVVLGSLTFQRHPTPLLIDGVAELHAELFRHLRGLDDPAARALRFCDYMAVYFGLERLEEVGLDRRSPRQRAKANYLRMVRGWSFDSDGREGAVLKGWVESRFGLLARYHGGPLHYPGDDAYPGYLEARSAGLYATNALEAQLDLLYTYGQYELARQHPTTTHLHLYRGVNRLDGHEILARTGRRARVVLLNNLSSFTRERERADELGDDILDAQVPVTKLFFYNRLLPDLLRGEDEYVVIGGVYEVALSLV